VKHSVNVGDKVRVQWVGMPRDSWVIGVLKQNDHSITVRDSRGNEYTGPTKEATVASGVES